MSKRKRPEDSGSQLPLFGEASEIVATPAPKKAPVKAEPEVYTVTELTRQLDRAIGADPVLGKPVTVQGELSNVSLSSRGHLYFMLKDGNAAIKGVLWASQVKNLKFDPTDGLEVFLTGKLEVYAPGGTYSIITQRMEPVGVGVLQLAFEQLKEKLSAEGLFDPDFKQDLPFFPLKIGIITSPTGAVIHDMLRVIRRKNPLVSVLLAPVAVQGEGAASQIAQALETLNTPALGLDLIILARGGGSLEDLFCFSEEPVVRGVFASRLPVVTGIGHEPDFSLADAASDYSASTPTAAAEYAVPDIEALHQHVAQRQDRLRDALEAAVREAEQRFDMAATRLTQTLSHWVESTQTRVLTLGNQLEDAMSRQLEQAQQQVQSMAAELNAYSPLSTLGRGYAIATVAHGRVLHSIQDVAPGASLSIQVVDGTVTCEVQSIHERHKP